MLKNATWGGQGNKQFTNILRMIKGTVPRSFPSRLWVDSETPIPSQDAPTTLLRTSFPPEQDPQEATRFRDLRENIWLLGKECTTKILDTELSQALKAIKKNTAAGLDGIGYGHLENLSPTWQKGLLRAYNEVLRSGEIPQAWLDGKIIYIPKAGKDHRFVNAWRPISILPLTTRVFDKIITRRITREIELSGFLHPRQHGFRPNFSTETLLREVLIQIENIRRNNKLFAIIGIDFTKAFDNILHSEIARGIQEILEQGDCREYGILMISYLQNRKVYTRFGGLSGEHETCKGIPQGGCMSPLLFNIGMKRLIEDLTTRESSYPFVFADDLTIVIEAKTDKELCTRIKDTFSYLEDHPARESFQINYNKTQILVSNSKRINWENMGVVQGGSMGLTFREHHVKFVNHMVLLGVTLTRDLKFDQHFHRIMGQVRGKFNQLKGLFGKKWGLSVDFLRTAGNMLLLSHFNYGIGVTWYSITQGTRMKLDRIQSDIARSILRLTRKAPVVPSAIIAFGFKLTETLRRDFLLFYLTTDRHRHWDAGGNLLPGKYLKRIYSELDEIGFPYQRNDIQVKKWEIKDPSLYKRIVFDGITKRETAIQECKTRHPGWSIFTDASRSNKTQRTGGGILLLNGPTIVQEMMVPFEYAHSIFDAESRTILEGLHLLPKGARARVYTDSYSSIQALLGYRSARLYVKRIWNLVLTNELNISFHWSPGHEGIVENERVDELAHMATLVPLPPRELMSRLTLRTWFKWKLEKRRLVEWQTDRRSRGSFHTNFVNSQQGIQLLYRRGFRHPEILRLVLNNVYHKQTLCFFKKAATPYCGSCPGHIENSTHILYHCPRYTNLRNRLWSITGPPPYRRTYDNNRWFFRDWYKVVALKMFLIGTNRFGPPQTAHNIPPMHAPQPIQPAGD